MLEELPDQEGYYVYLLLCHNGSLYCGWTTNIKRRYMQHINKTGAKYTKANPPKSVYYYESFSSATEARKREYAIKQMTHLQKIALK